MNLEITKLKTLKEAILFLIIGLGFITWAAIRSKKNNKNNKGNNNDE